MKVIHEVGSRKKATARATLSVGSGIVRINSQLLQQVMPILSRRKIEEALFLAGGVVKEVDISINVRGGGSNSQAEASRLAIARALSTYKKDLQEVYLNYDRNFLVADVRQKETHKPNCHGKARAKRQKSYR